MTDLSRILRVRAGLHASASDFTTAPSSYAFLEPESIEAAPRDRERLPVTPYRGDNREALGVVGKWSLDPLAMTFRLRGMSNNSGGAIASATACDLGNIFTSIFGAAAADPSSTATTVTGGVGSAATLTVTSGTNIPTGMTVWFATSTGKWVARRVASGGGTTGLTLDSAYAGTATAAGTVIRAPTWSLSPSVANHTHIGFDIEATQWRRTYFGCLSGAQFEFTEGQCGKVSTSWMPSNLSYPTAGMAAFSAPTVGNDVVALGGEVWIGGVQFIAKNIKIDLGYTIQPRACIDGDNGVAGYVVVRKAPVITATLYYGTLSSGGELSEATGAVNLRTLQETVEQSGVTSTARSVAIQVGSHYSAGCYWSAPSCEVRAKVGDDNGLPVINVEMRPTRSTATADLYFGLA